MLRKAKKNTQKNLIPEQKRMIKSSIKSFLDFSSTSAIFLEQVELLAKAFSNPLKSENPYQKIAECFFFPENNLQGLEKYNPNTTIAMVRAYVLKYVNKKLKKSAKKAHVSLEETSWNKNYFSTHFITRENRTHLFTSIEAPPAEEKPEWIDIHDKNNIYKFSLSLDQRTAETTLSVTILSNGNDNNTTTDVITENIPLGTMQNQQFEDEYLISLIPSAKIEAEKFAKNFALNALHENGIFSSSVYLLLQNDNNINPFIIKEFYLTQLIKGRLDILKIINLTPIQIKVISHSLSIFLLKNQLCLLSELLHLTEYDLEAANLFNRMLTKRQLHIINFRGTSKEQKSLWHVPIVNRLIQSEKLLLERSKTLTHLRPLFIKQIYTQYFLKNPINWQLFSEIDQETCAFLIDPNIIPLVINDVLIMRRYAPEFCLALKRKNIFQLLSQKIVSANQIIDLSLRQVDLIDNQPHLYAWIESGLILAGNINPHRLDKFYAEVCAKRLFAIMQNKAFRINDVLDTSTQVTHDLTELAAQAKIRVSVLLSKSLKNLLRLIQEDLLQLKAQVLTDYERHFFNTILRKINLKETQETIKKINNVCYNAMLDNNSSLSVSKHKPFVFFKNKTNNINIFCLKFTALMVSLHFDAVNTMINEDNKIDLRRS